MNLSIIGKADGPTSIFLAGRFGNLFMMPAFLIIVFFYGIYFAKQISAKRQGIRTNQLGRRKEKSVRIREFILTAAAVFIVPAQVVSILFDLSRMPSALRVAGIVLGILGDLIFLTAVLTMKSSWRAGIPVNEKTEFVSCGIYRYSRNPAFVGFDLMYIGILMMYFNLGLLVITVWAAGMLHLQILQEERYLQAVFGEEYLAYKMCTCRYLGRKKQQTVNPS